VSFTFIFMIFYSRRIVRHGADSRKSLDSDFQFCRPIYELPHSQSLNKRLY
jgi:hypothetical protein